MSLMPKRIRWRKQQRGQIRGIATRGHSLAFGEYGVQSLDRAWITAAQIEAARVAATRAIGPTGRLFGCLFSTPSGRRYSSGPASSTTT